MIDVAGAIVGSHDRAGGSLIQYNYFARLSDALNLGRSYADSSPGPGLFHH